MEREAQVANSEPAYAPAPQTTSELAQVTENVPHGTSESETPPQTNGQENKPAGFDRVEIPAELQPRFDRIYANMKRYESDAKEQRRLNEQLITEFSNIQQNQQQIVSHLQVSDFQDAENRLNNERDAAWKKGDYAAFTASNDKLQEIKTQRILAARDAQNKPAAQAKQQPQQPGIGADRLVNTAIDKGEINSVDANIARAWMSETDQSGNLKRPWTNQNDPRNYSAALEGQAVFNSPQWVDKPIADKLKEVDRRMGLQTQTQTNVQNVLGAGNLTRGGKNNNIKLTDVERTIALKTKFGGPKAKSDEDHAAAYLQAKIKSQPKGASR